MAYSDWDEYLIHQVPTTLDHVQDSDPHWTDRFYFNCHARDGSALVRVTDDGAGFDPARLALGSHGLVGMRYRVQAEGGQLHIHTAPGAGTRVQALLPLAVA